MPEEEKEGTEDIDYDQFSPTGSEEDDVEILIEGVDDELIQEYKKTVQSDATGLPPEQLTQEQLISQMKALDEANRKLKEQQDYQALSQRNAQEMANAIKQAVQPLAQTNPAPQPQAYETEEQFQERIRELHHDDPYKAALAINERQFGPLIQTLAGNNLKTARALMMLDPKEGPLMQRFADEVDRIVGSKSDLEKLRNPDIYKQALNEIKSKNFDLLVEERAKQLASEKQNTQTKGNSNATSASTPPAKPIRSYSETNYNPVPRGEGGVKKVIGSLTPDEKRRAFVIGQSEKDYYKYLRSKGLKP